MAVDLKNLSFTLMQTQTEKVFSMAKKSKTNKRIRTLYNPKVGCQYQIRNVETGEIIIASTLTIRDETQKPWRSPKDTPRGQEFFKMKTGSKRNGVDNFTYYKFMNSILNEKCLSDDGKWEFIGKTGKGIDINKVDEKTEKKEETKQIQAAASSSTVSEATPVNNVVNEKPQESMSVEEIREDIMDSEFSNSSALDELLND